MITTSPKPLLKNQHGIALIASLIIMLLMTIVALSVFRGNNLLEKIAGNTREKQRAFQSAQDALLYGEYWLNSASSASLTTVAASACTGSAITTLQVCPSTNLATVSNFSSLAWYRSYTPPGMTVGASSTAGGLASASALSDVKYSQNPGIYIALLGNLSGTTTPVYQVTAIGYGGNGGNNGTVAIVQSVFKPGSSGGGTPPPVFSGL